MSWSCPGKYQTDSNPDTGTDVACSCKINDARVAGREPRKEVKLGKAGSTHVSLCRILFLKQWNDFKCDMV